MVETELITICDEIEAKLSELLPENFGFDSKLDTDGVHVYIGYLVKRMFGYIEIDYFFEICVGKNETRGRYLYYNGLPPGYGEYERGPWFAGEFEDLVHTAVTWWKLNDKRHS